MNTFYGRNTIQRQNEKRSLIGHRGPWPRLALVLGIALVSCLFPSFLSPHPIQATGPDGDAPALYELVSNGEGNLAVEQLAALALERGGWGPAPGDEAVYDARLSRTLRASTQVSDYADDCVASKYDAPGLGCSTDLETHQAEVRFGFFTFANEAGDGVVIARPLDDMLSVYIEEVGHSWQEYLHETEGRGSGERVRLISAIDGQYLAKGWEYQIKVYILSLDGVSLALSDAERQDLKASICDAEGYANPTKGPVPSYGAPTGWPQAEYWPTAAPTPEEFQVFCARS